MTGPRKETHVLAPEDTAFSTADASVIWPEMTVALLAISGGSLDALRTKSVSVCPSRKAARQKSMPAGPTSSQNAKRWAVVPYWDKSSGANGHTGTT